MSTLAGGGFGTRSSGVPLRRVQFNRCHCRMQANSPRIRASRIASAIVVTVQTTFIGEPDQKLRTLKSPTPRVTLFTNCLRPHIIVSRYVVFAPHIIFQLRDALSVILFILRFSNRPVRRYRQRRGSSDDREANLSDSRRSRPFGGRA
jgi:hypothetical protein